MNEALVSRSLLIVNPAAAVPIPEQQRPQVDTAFTLAQELAREVTELEDALGAADDGDLPGHQARLRAAIDQALELAPALEDLLSEVEQLAEEEAYQAELRARIAALSEVATAPPGPRPGAGLLAGQANSVQIPYLDMSGEEPVWRIAFPDRPPVDIQAELQGGKLRLTELEEGGWVAASPDNRRSRDESTWRPVFTRHFVTNASSPRWVIREREAGRTLRQALIKAGLVEEVRAPVELPSYALPDARPGDAEKRDQAYTGLSPELQAYFARLAESNARDDGRGHGPGGLAGDASSAGGEPPVLDGVLYCESAEPAFPEPTRTCTSIGCGIEAAMFRDTRPYYLRPTAKADWNTLRWLEEGCPGKVWVGYHRSESTFQHLLRETGEALEDTFKNPIVAGALTVLAVPAAIGALASMSLPTWAGAAAQQSLTGVAQNTGLDALMATLSPAATQALQAYVVEQGVDGRELSRDLARMIVSGWLVPGFGPIASLLLPQQANRALQKLTAEAFYTVPGFGALVAHAETNRARRKELRELFAARRARLFHEYRLDLVIDVVQGVMRVIEVILSATGVGLILAGALEALNYALSAYDAAMQAQIIADQFQLAKRALEEQRGDPTRLITMREVNRQLEAELAALEAELAFNPPAVSAGEVPFGSPVMPVAPPSERSPEAGPSTGKALAVAALLGAIGLAYAARRR